MKIFPKEILDNTSQNYLPQIQAHSKVIYALILLLLCGGLIAMPFIHIELYSSARGLVKPEKERVGITCLNPGQVIYSSIIENGIVNQGDTLLILQSKILDEKILLTQFQMEQIEEEINDLRYLVDENGIDINRLNSAKFQKELIEYKEKIDDHFIRIKKLKVDYDRKKKLLSRGVIAKVEYDNIQFDLELARNALYQYKKRQINSWQAILTSLEKDYQEIKNQEVQLIQNKGDYVVTAPIAGNLIDVSAIETGSLITSGSALGYITPRADLIAEFYISPFDIGLIDRNKKVKLQVDAFNYNQWGQLSASILEISKDVQFINNEPLFRVRCKMDQEFLELPTGRKGYIKKGMTLGARFSLADRTLYQLLYDKVDDWLHP